MDAGLQSNSMHILCGKLCCSRNSNFRIGKSEHYVDVVLDSVESGFRAGVVAESGDSWLVGGKLARSFKKVLCSLNSKLFGGYY